MTNHTLSDWLMRLEHVTGKAPRRSGDEYRFPCPAHGGDGFNLAIVERNGKILSTCHSHGCSHDAVRAAIGLDPPESQAIEHRYEYRKADGSLHLTVAMKRDAVTGKKTGNPWREPSGVKGPHPLYRLPELLDAGTGRTVLVVEGEHTCDAARAAWPREPVVTWAGGCKGWRQSDWTPLRGRTVTICADTDEQGREAARAIGAHLHGIGAAVSLALPEGDTGADMADWLREDRSAAHGRLQRLKAPYVPENEPSGLPTLTLAELLDRPDDATEWLVEGILPAGGFSALTGKPKSGKSTAGRHLAHAIVTGERWLDRDTMTGPVLYLALEEKVSEVRRHFMALRTPRDAPLRICFHRTPGDAEALLAETVAAFNPILVIVDTLFRFQPVGDTSSYGDVLKALTPLHGLARESGAHVLVVHHERKTVGEGMDRVLGSTAISGTVDVMLSIERSHADNVRVISSVGRYGEDLPETVIELRPDGSVRLAGDAGEIRQRRDRERVLDYLTTHPGATQDEIKDGSEMRWQAGRSALSALVKAGDVLRSGAGKAGNPYRYHSVNVQFPNGGNQTWHSEGECLVPQPKGGNQTSGVVPEPPGNQRNHSR